MDCALIAITVPPCRSLADPVCLLFGCDPGNAVDNSFTWFNLMSSTASNVSRKANMVVAPIQCAGARIHIKVCIAKWWSHLPSITDHTISPIRMSSSLGSRLWWNRTTSLPCRMLKERSTTSSLLEVSFTHVANLNSYLNCVISLPGGAAACITAGRLAAADPSLKILVCPHVVVIANANWIYVLYRLLRPDLTFANREITSNLADASVIWPSLKRLSPSTEVMQAQLSSVALWSSHLDVL